MKQSTFKPNQIIIRSISHATELKYEVRWTQFIGDVEVCWGIRIKRDKDCWVTFGQERALLPHQYRLFTDDDYHYI